jgi:hypothetical protein
MVDGGGWERRGIGAILETEARLRDVTQLAFETCEVLTP